MRAVTYSILPFATDLPAFQPSRTMFTPQSLYVGPESDDQDPTDFSASTTQSSNLPYATPSPQSLCQECRLWPKAITAQGYEHPFCSKTCARKHFGSLHVANPSQALCLGCGLYPQARSGTIQYPHCSKTCARKWPIRSQTCAFNGCTTRITGAFGVYCSTAHRNQARRPNVLHKKPISSPSPPPLGQKMSNPLPASAHGNSVQPQRLQSSQSNPLHQMQMSSRRRILFYDKHAPHYGFTNFSNHPVVYLGKNYPTSEHLFQAFKFHDHAPHLAEHIRKCSDKPSVAFAEARRHHQDVRPDWHLVKIEKMDVALRHKFTQHSSLKAELLATGDAELVEDSPIDAFWGVGHDGRGRNELGKALMRLRVQLRNAR